MVEALGLFHFLRPLVALIVGTDAGGTIRLDDGRVQAGSAVEQALAQDPEHRDAQQNLAITRAIIAYLNEARSQGGTEVGADDYRFDNTAAEGQGTVVVGQAKLALESAEQWMRAVETQPADFLRTKFAQEAAKGSAP